MMSREHEVLRNAAVNTFDHFGDPSAQAASGTSFNPQRLDLVKPVLTSAMINCESPQAVETPYSQADLLLSALDTDAEQCDFAFGFDRETKENQKWKVHVKRLSDGKLFIVPTPLREDQIQEFIRTFLGLYAPN
ncbi:hypothetical protein DFH11DRAFT_1741669 [Phellopilus nigrolimitatus]|nr:hypothetical protein DFH11DRAFT_1741669 [Phellopilus nigrolimitatus]